MNRLQTAFEQLKRAAAPVEIAIGDGRALTAESLPVFGRAGGLDVVVITADVYRTLVAGQLSAMKPVVLRNPAPLPSTVERDPEVAGFLRERFGQAATVDMAHAACLDRFGADRTPSRARIQTFRRRTRGGT